MEVILKNKSYQRTCRMHSGQLYRKTRGRSGLNLSNIPIQGHSESSVFRQLSTIRYIETVYETH